MRKFIVKSNVYGWMGKTHALLSVMLLCICLLIPINVFEQTIWLLKDNILFFIVGLTVLVGGALLPDLDNCSSSAGSTLGFMGSIVTIFMQSTSSIIWTLVHTKRERMPMTPHRYFWHTLFASAGIICLFWFGMPTGESTIFGGIKELTLGVFLQENVALLFFMFILFMAVLCGSDMILYRLVKWFKLPKLISYILPVLVLIYTFTLDYTHLKILGLCIGFGYLFHCLEDFFADSGVPLLWPLPLGGHCWYKCHFIVTCTTGGLINTILDIVVLAIDIGLIALIFLKGRGVV